MKALFQLPHWLKNGLAAHGSPVPYQITCTCGHAAEGLRQATHQVIHCGNCNRELFVLPVSSLPVVAPPGAATSASKSAVAGLPSKPWFWPLVAGGLTLLAAVLVYVLLLDQLLTGRRPGASVPGLAELDQRLAAGRKALLAGEFKQARQELDNAQTILAAHAATASAAQRQDVRQLQRQAVLLSDWPREPLELTLAPAMGLKTDDWQAFTARYRGKAFVFDVEARRDAGRQYLAKASRKVTGPALQLELQNLKLLSYLPLDEPQRVLFAARLAEVRREGPDSCIVRLEPDSAVLLTDTSSAALGRLIADGPLQTILKQQQQWVAAVP